MGIINGSERHASSAVDLKSVARLREIGCSVTSSRHFLQAVVRVVAEGAEDYLRAGNPIAHRCQLSRGFSMHGNYDMFRIFRLRSHVHLDH